MRFISLVTLLILPSAFGGRNQPKKESPPSAECNVEVDGSCVAERTQEAVDTDVSKDTDSQLPSDDSSSCGLYLAESSIPNSGLGMFTAKPIGHEERIYYGDIVCNVEDFEENMNLRRRFLKRSSKSNPTWLMDSYYWSPTNALAAFEAEEVSSVIPGLGMLANSHPGLVNAIQRPPSRVTDLNRAEDPGAGASTTFHDVHFIAENDIEAGAELFVEYGDSWFRERRKDIGNIPLSYHWEHADTVLKKYSDIFNGDLGSTVSSETYELLKLAVDLEPRLKNAFPTDVNDVPKAVEDGAAKALLPGRVKTKEWLQENGMCLDNLRPGMSTLRQAGRGAFATRKLAKGSVIAPLPVVQMRRYHMEVYEIRSVDTPNSSGDDDEEEEEEEEIVRSGYQLLMNYCFGHRQSTLLLFPYSPVVNYLNHNQTLKNAELRWSNHTSHRKDWLDRSPADLDVEKYSGLIMEVVATRDIEAGEEVFLDYGDEWEEAWQNFLFQWQPSAEKYVSAADRNAQNEPLLTEDEMEKDRSYDNVLLACFVTLPKDDSPDDDVPTTFAWTPPKTFDVDDFHECLVGKRSTDGSKYDVVIEEKDRTWIVKDIPRDAIQYFDAMYTSDMFIRSAFRHEMGLRDDMVPDAWRDITMKN